MINIYYQCTKRRPQACNIATEPVATHQIKSLTVNPSMPTAMPTVVIWVQL